MIKALWVGKVRSEVPIHFSIIIGPMIFNFIKNSMFIKYKLKTEESIDKACASILKKYYTTDFFEYSIKNNPIITYKNKKRGRPAKNKKQDKIAVSTDHFSVGLKFEKAPFEKALYRCGYYPLLTNKSREDLTIEAAMMAHKKPV